MLLVISINRKRLDWLVQLTSTWWLEHNLGIKKLKLKFLIRKKTSFHSTPQWEHDLRREKTYWVLWSVYWKKNYTGKWDIIAQVLECDEDASLESQFDLVSSDVLKNYYFIMQIARLVVFISLSSPNQPTMVMLFWRT